MIINKCDIDKVNIMDDRLKKRNRWLIIIYRIIGSTIMAISYSFTSGDTSIYKLLFFLLATTFVNTIPITTYYYNLNSDDVNYTKLQTNKANLQLAVLMVPYSFAIVIAMISGVFYKYNIAIMILMSVYFIIITIINYMYRRKLKR
jgi:hypothetical protein